MGVFALDLTLRVRAEDVNILPVVVEQVDDPRGREPAVSEGDDLPDALFARPARRLPPDEASPGIEAGDERV